LPKVKKGGLSSPNFRASSSPAACLVSWTYVEGTQMNTVNEDRIVAAPERLVAETRAEFRNAAVSLIESVGREARTITLDLSMTRVMDATGLGTLVAIQTRAKQFGLTVRLANVAEEVYALLALTELLHLFAIERA
jgi:anti-anti-sigma factor